MNKHTNKQIMTIFISDTGMRLMLTDGKQVSDWSEIDFAPGQIEGSVVNDEYADNIVAQIKQVLDFKSVNVKKVLIAISGIRCLTRPLLLPKLPKEILDEAVHREAVRVLPVPPDELYMTYQSIAAPEGKTQVFLTAIPKRILDPLMNTLDKAGLKPVFLDIKPLLLARVSSENTTILIDVQKMDFDIVIMMKGVPQPIRTVPFSLENPTREDKIAMIREELERTITFYNSNNPESIVDDTLSIHVSGVLDDEDEFCRLLSEETHRDVRMLPSPVSVPEGFNFSRYMANISLIQQEAAVNKRTGNSVVSMNSLPLKYRMQPVSSTNILKLLGAAFAVLLVLSLGVLISSTYSSISSKRTALDTSRSLLQQQQLETQIINKQINDLKAEISAMETLQTNLASALTALEARSLGLNLDIQTTAGNSPDAIQLTEVTHDNGQMAIKGVVPLASTVDLYVASLFKTGRFTDIRIENMTMQEDTTHTFTLNCSLSVDSNWVSSIGVILGNLPGTITIQFAATSDTALTLNGNSMTENALMKYLEKLDGSGKFRLIEIVEIIRVEDNSLDFTVVLWLGE
ncbi:MAG: pilus assembly protein PilM [Dehalococcoidales bacterium]|nr:pilus assembly protein PilM [Dehalococcoidales bacterium]